MYTLEDGQQAVKYARTVIEHHLNNEPVPDEAAELDEKFERKSGVFVTLNTYPDRKLRGCIGFPEPQFKLIDGIRDAAVSAATRDPRFPPVTSRELEKIVVEVSLLTPPKEIEFEDASELPAKITIGEDGLIAERGYLRGLLLPQVPVEWDWDSEEFLGHTCMKAGMGRDGWRKGDVTFYRFSGEIFMETEPGGEIVSKPLTD